MYDQLTRRHLMFCSSTNTLKLQDYSPGSLVSNNTDLQQFYQIVYSNFG